MAPSRLPPNLNDGGQQSAPFTIRANAKSRTAKSQISASLCPELPLFAREGTGI
jgi:hypothetical protein